VNNLTNIPSDNQDNKKIALVIGIDRYIDNEIPILSGAENDAKELFELLTSEIGGFEQDETKYLLYGERARQRNILERISDIFREDDTLEIALLYFSGHGFVDKRGDLYLATYDISKKDPYIGGINVSDLQHQIYSSINKKNTIMILDCCYSGTATKGTKDGDSSIKNLLPILEENVIDTKQEDYGGEGKFTISSSAGEKVSWEMNDCKHSDEDTPHTHGEFTYHLLEGIRGGASDEISGEITLLSLQQYIDNKLAERNKQKSYLKIHEGSNLGAITIAYSVGKNKQYIENIINHIKTLFPPQENSFPLIGDIIEGARKLKELKEKKPNHPDIPTFRNILSSKLDIYKEGVLYWCYGLPNSVQAVIKSKTDRNSIDDFIDRVSNIQLESVSDTETNIEAILNIVGKEAKNKTVFTNEKDPKLSSFLTRLLPAYKRFKAWEGTHHQ
jgi:hypothetical protein